jgi:hypothetical protein
VEVREDDRVLGLGTHERRVIDLDRHADAGGSERPRSEEDPKRSSRNR